MFLSFASFILTIIYKIRSGHGLDYYFTGYGVQMNYIGVLISLIVIPFTLLVVWGVVIILNKKEIWEIEKYKKSRLLKKKMKKQQTGEG